MSGTPVYTNISVACKLDFDDKMDNNGRKVSRRKFEPYTRAVWIFLGLLFFILLVVIVILVAHNFMAISSWNSHLQSSDEKSGNLSSMVMELQEKMNNLTQMNKLEKTMKGLCSSLEWIEVNRECYYFSPKGVSKTWAKSKKDCEAQRGRLVTIKNRSKLQLLGLFHEQAWIGLSDRKTEGTWVWEDGTGLVKSELWVKGEPNDADGDEDCVNLIATSTIMGFNDSPCGSDFPYICETLE